MPACIHAHHNRCTQCCERFHIDLVTDQTCAMPRSKRCPLTMGLRQRSGTAATWHPSALYRRLWWASRSQALVLRLVSSAYMGKKTASRPDMCNSNLEPGPPSIKHVPFARGMLIIRRQRVVLLSEIGYEGNDKRNSVQIVKCSWGWPTLE